MYTSCQRFKMIITRDRLNNMLAAATADAVTQSKTKIDELEGRIVALEAHLQNYLNLLKKKASEDPYIQVLSESFDEENGLEIKLDWNPAMINYLKRNGYRGIDDDEVIMKYVADMFNEKRINDPPPPVV
jgi:hypothetical protein